MQTLPDNREPYDVYTVVPGAIGNVLERHTVKPSTDSTSGSKYYQYNHLGDVIMATDSTGAMLWAQDFTAFGDIATDDHGDDGGSGVKDDLLITGKDWDAELGLYYFNARWYDPETGRFISETPLAPWVEGAYVYCNNNPIAFADPNGLLPVFAIIIAVDMLLNFLLTWHQTGSLSSAALESIISGFATAIGGKVGGILAKKLGSKLLSGIGAGAVSGFVSGIPDGINTDEPLKGALCSAKNGAIWGTIGALVPGSPDDSDYWEAVGAGIAASTGLAQRAGGDIGNAIDDTLVGPGHWRKRMRQIEQECGLGDSVWPGL